MFIKIFSLHIQWLHLWFHQNSLYHSANKINISKRMIKIICVSFVNHNTNKYPYLINPVCVFEEVCNQIRCYDPGKIQTEFVSDSWTQVVKEMIQLQTWQFVRSRINIYHYWRLFWLFMNCEKYNIYNVLNDLIDNMGDVFICQIHYIWETAGM